MDTERVFNEVESLKIEIANLNSQLIKEEERNISYQQRIVDLTKENLQMRSDSLRVQNSKLFDTLGVKGNIKFVKMEDNRYKLAPEGQVE